MKKLNKQCIVCSTKYSYCSSCAEDKKKPLWMNQYCSENCRNLFTAASDYIANEITKDEAKRVVQNADLRNKSNFRESIIDFINEMQTDAIQDHGVNDTNIEHKNKKNK